MLAEIAMIVVLIALLAAFARSEDARLRRAARRYRELEYEGIEELRPRDPYPEEASVDGGYLREPDGRPADAERVLHEEMERAREHTRLLYSRRSRRRSLRRGKGSECLV
jgi:hypothetical protein